MEYPRRQDGGGRRSRLLQHVHGDGMQLDPSPQFHRLFLLLPLCFPQPPKDASNDPDDHGGSEAGRSDDLHRQLLIGRQAVDVSKPEDGNDDAHKEEPDGDEEHAPADGFDQRSTAGRHHRSRHCRRVDRDQLRRFDARERGVRGGRNPLR